MSVAVVDEVGYAGLGEETASRLFAASLSKVGLDVARIGRPQLDAYGWESIARATVSACPTSNDTSAMTVVGGLRKPRPG